MSYWLHPVAEADLTEAAVFYSQNASNRIAEAFLVEFERVIALLEENQRLGTLVKGGLRIHPFHRFPYSVVYRESESGPRVYAVSHQKRRPNHWRSRL